MAEPSIFGIERVNNPHILPIFQALSDRPDIRFTGCVLLPQAATRVALGWPELPEDATLLQPWRGADELRRYFELARSADVVIWPGLRHLKGIRLIRSRLKRGKLNMIWAERFILRRRRSWLQRCARRQAIRRVNHPDIHLMTMGDGAQLDYRQYGATKWQAWQFGYAVQPHPTLDHDLEPAPDGAMRLLFAGELCHRKAVDVLLAALGRATLRDHSWNLTVVGDGDQRSNLEEQAADLNLTDKVRFLGVIPREAVDRHFSESDIVVLPSRFDGWGAIINEGMEHGLAVIASDAVGAGPLLIADGVNGFVFANEDVAALADRLARLLSDRALCASMRRASRSRIEQFRPAESAQRVAALCRGLTGHGPMPHYEEGLCMPLS
ncbi:MAG: glycosyltransferase [Planctomycetes bacterium]|nr:glycosyltransferase [Planctomycetota bacterium]